MSLSDGAPMMTMPVAPANSYGGGMGMWAKTGSGLSFFFLFGWGPETAGGNNAGNSGGVVDGYVLTSDFANVERKIDSVNQGLCDGFLPAGAACQRHQHGDGKRLCTGRAFPQQPAGGADATTQRHADAGR